MLAVSAAFACALLWGAGDFLGGLQARRIQTAAVMLGSSVTGLLLAGSVVLVAGREAPPAADLAYAVVAGLVVLLALSSFYRALAIGTMSIVAPISSSGMVVPVAYGIATGERVTTMIAAGFVLTAAGVVLASREPAEELLDREHDAPDDAEPLPGTPGADRGRRVAVEANQRMSVVLALVAASCFGALYVLIERASRNDIFWAVSVQRAVPLVAIGAAVLVWRSRSGWRSVRPRSWAATSVVGLLDTTAISAYAYASTRGPLGVMAVIAAIFPVFTVLLAHLVLGERIARLQRAGVLLALAGVALLAAS